LPLRIAIALGALVLPVHGQGAGIDPSVEKPLTQFIASEKAREASIHLLHLVLDQSATYILSDGTVVKPPKPTHLEAWLDIV
jgi:hypothetical protein